MLGTVVKAIINGSTHRCANLHLFSVQKHSAKLTAQEIAVLEGIKIKTGLSKRSDLSTEKVHSQNGAASMLPHSIRGHKREKTMVPFQHLYNEVPFEITTLNEHSKQSK